MSRIAWAQAYPSRPVRIIVGFAAGGGNDIVARLMGQWLSERLGQPFVIENRPGAGTNIATQAVVNAAPDGYTLLLVGVDERNQCHLLPKAQFQFHPRYRAGFEHHAAAASHAGTNHRFQPRQFPRSSIMQRPIQARSTCPRPESGAHQSSRRRTVQDDGWRQLVHVPFSGNSPALTALLGGQVEVPFASLPSSIEYIRTGKLRGLAVTSAMRSEALPDVPAVGEFVPGYEVSAWYGVGAPKGTPAEIIDKINKEINAGLADPKLKARIADFGGTVFALSPADFGKFIADETEKWAKVIRAANIKAG